MDETKTFVKEVIPDVGSSFTLDENVIACGWPPVTVGLSMTF